MLSLCFFLFQGLPNDIVLPHLRGDAMLFKEIGEQMERFMERWGPRTQDVGLLYTPSEKKSGTFRHCSQRSGEITFFARKTNLILALLQCNKHLNIAFSEPFL